MEVTRSYEIKLKPNKTQRRKLDQYFEEAKYFFNYVLQQNSDTIFDWTLYKHVDICRLDKEGNKLAYHIKILPSGIRQGIQRQIQNSIICLSRLKKKGHKVGRIKQKKFITTLDLSNQCYRVIDLHHVSITGLGRRKSESSIRCYGLKQLGDVIKYRNAKLMKLDDEYFLKICILKEVEDHQPTHHTIGIDMGVETSVTLSTGEKINCSVKETKKLKKLQKKFARSHRMNHKKITRNGWRLLIKLRKEYRHMENMKKDKTNKLMNYLDTYFDHIAFQDESLKQWRNLKSCKKKLHHSFLGKVKTQLKMKLLEDPLRYHIHDKWVPTTQYCPRCRRKNKHGLEERTYHCSCGYTEDRDIHAARNMLILANIPVA